MKGQIAITKLQVDRNRMGWSVFDFFKDRLREYTTSASAGWYAYKLKGGIYYFLWADSNEWATEKYLDSLKRDGYILAFPIDKQPITDAFK